METEKLRDILAWIKVNTGGKCVTYLWKTLIMNVRIFVLLYSNLKPVIKPRATGIYLAV